MNLYKRFTSWWLLFFHGMRQLKRGEVHIEVCETEGFMMFGIYAGIVFKRRYCATCGYMEEKEK